jgi:hypothetical protein
MVFNATFNNISDISWRSVLLVEETGVPGENYQSSPSQARRANRLKMEHELAITICLSIGRF